MNILVTGGMGYIGSHTCVQMIEAGLTPIIVDNLSNSKTEVLNRIEHLTQNRPTFYEGDIRDTDFLIALFDKQKQIGSPIEAVIHFAGLKAVGESVAYPIEYYLNNVSGTLSLIQAMKFADVKRIIFSSSATVYGDPTIVPVPESSATGVATSPYGTSKFMIEQCLKDLSFADASWQITLLRYFNPVGAHPSGIMGEDPKGIPNNLMPYIAQVAVGKLPKLTIFGNDYPTKDGTGVRDYVHVLDLADGHVAALKAQSTSQGLQIFNLGTGIGASVLDMVKAFSQASGQTIAYQFASRRAGDIAENFACTKRAQSELNWQAKYGIEQMAKDTWLWQSNNPSGYESP